MSDDQQEKTLGQMLDEDKGFITSRRLLMTLSILLLVSVFGGISIKEANTFIFKLEFLNPKALNVLLAIAVFSCAVRYYAFATPYHRKIQRVWSSKMFHFGGVDKFQIYSGIQNFFPDVAKDEHDREFLNYAFYEVKLGLRRRLVLPYIELPNGDVLFTGDRKNLFSFSEYWTFFDLLRMYYIETTLRLDAILKNREYLDVLFPYWVAIAAEVSYVLATLFPTELASLLQGNFQQLWLPRSI